MRLVDACLLLMIGASLGLVGHAPPVEPGAVEMRFAAGAQAGGYGEISREQGLPAGWPRPS